MAKLLPPIEDYYGTEIEVDPIFKSAGPYVYLNRRKDIERIHDPGIDGTMDRLDPDQARDLAKRLKQAADEVDPVQPENRKGSR